MILDTEQPADNQAPTENAAFLVVDCGTAHTSASLIDQAAGSYRLLGHATTPTTTAPPWLDVMEGVQQCIRHLSDTTGRPLLGDSTRLIRPTRKNGSGIDQFTAVISAADPLKVIIVGLFDDVSVASARHLLHTIYAQEVDTISLSDTRTEAEQVASMLRHQPDLFLITGGTNGGAASRLLQMVDTVSLGIQVLASVKRPQVLYVGNVELQSEVELRLGKYANVIVGDNLRPVLDQENLDDAARVLANLYEDIKVNTLPGMRDLHDWKTVPFSTPARAFAKAVEYFAVSEKQRILGIDLGCSQTTIVDATAKRTRLHIESEFGTGRPITNLLDHVSAAEIAAILPDKTTPEEVVDFIYNKSLYPYSIAMTDAEMQMEQAAARMLMQATAVKAGLPASLNGYGRLIARGGTLSHAARPGQTMLMLLDALMPCGIFTITLDHIGVLPSLGILAKHQPLAVVQTIETGILSDLGTVIAPIGRANPGQRVMHMRVESPQGTLEIEAPFGKLEVLPLAPGQTAKVTIEPGKRFDIGFGPGKGKTLTVTGGTVGIVVDTRGRPLRLPEDEEAQHKLRRQWLWDMGG